MPATQGTAPAPADTGWTRLGLRPALEIRGYEDAMHVLRAAEHRYDRVPRMLGASMRAVVPTSTVTSSRADAPPRRRVLNRALHARHLPELEPRIRSRARATAHGWAQRGWVVPVADFGRLGAATSLDIVLGDAWTRDDPGLARAAFTRERAFDAAVINSLPWMPSTLLGRWRSRDLVPRLAAVAARIEPGAPCVVGRLREADREGPAALGEVLALTWAGRAAVAQTLAWAWLELARHPAVRARLREEADDDASPFAAAVVRETLRLRPVSARVVRQAVDDDRLPSGRRVRAGTRVSVSIAALHRRGSDRADPGRFDPQRMLDSPPPATGYLPFGAGARGCPGRGLALLETAATLREVVRVVEPQLPESESRRSARRRPLSRRVPVVPA